ncbi:hypothetical protein MHU86_12033 [Fragilaria crotonensis]|nr:hypothetical protein MHU86_12033 [Fragilaria crotonensis]
MLTVETNVPNPAAAEPTLRDLAHQAASDAKLNSFAHAYEPDPSKALRVATTLSKDFPADTRLANLCDSGLVNQMAFLMDVPNGPATLAILSCPFPTAKGTEAVFAGSLGDAMDVICPVTIRMRDVKGQCITIAPMTSLPTLLSMAISASDPLNEEGPDPEEGTVADPPGPDRLGIEISDPTDTPCITLIPKIFPLTGGYSIPTANIIDVTTTDTIRNLPGSPNLDEFHLWYESMSRFTVVVNFLTPNDPLYRKVTSAVLATKENAYVTYGSKLTRRIAFTTPPKAPERINASATHITPTDNVEAILLNLTSAITDNSSKAMTSTEREHESEAKENQAFYEILFASIIETTNDDGTTTKTFKKAALDSVFIQVLKANKNSKATKLLQTAIEAVASEMNFKDNRFASASDLKAELFDQPLTAAIRTATWAHQHTVLHPEGIKTHFAFHHLAPARTWTAEYKTRMEGAIKVIQQEQVEEASSRTNAKSTELYHFGKMGGINDINTSIGNFYCLMNTIIVMDTAHPPTVWTEIVEFDKVMRTTEGRRWFELHRNAKELMFNVFQEITSTIAGFVAVARRQGYRNAVSTGTISPEIFKHPQMQGTQLRQNLQSTILTMTAGPYKEASFVFKQFQPPEAAKKRQAQGEAAGESPTNRTRTTGTTPTNTNRIPRNPTTGNTPNASNLLDNIAQPTAAQGKQSLNSWPPIPLQSYSILGQYSLIHRDQTSSL